MHRVHALHTDGNSTKYSFAQRHKTELSTFKTPPPVTKNSSAWYSQHTPPQSAQPNTPTPGPTLEQYSSSSCMISRHPFQAAATSECRR
jgi:hypothetical protein